MTDAKTNREARILVVDDDQVDRRSVRRALSGAYAVVEAENGLQAIEMLASDPVDCVLLDYDIPGTNILAFVTALSKQVPIVILTGRGDEAVAVALMKAVAHDYLRKDGFSSESLDLAIRLAVSKAARRKERKAADERLWSEYKLEKQKRQHLENATQVARDIQQIMIPSAPPELDGCDIAGVYLPAESTGGDFFDYLPLSDGSLGIVVGDVSGHGLGSALLALEVRAGVRALAQAGSEIEQIVTIANHLLWKDSGGKRFATLFFGKLAGDRKSITYASAGQRAIVVHKSGATTQLQNAGFPVGVSQEMQVPLNLPQPLNSGDILLLTTDGLAEMQAPDQALFGMDRSLAIVRDHGTDPAEKIVDRLVLAAQSFARGERQHDDVTIVVVKVL